MSTERLIYDDDDPTMTTTTTGARDDTGMLFSFYTFTDYFIQND